MLTSTTPYLELFVAASGATAIVGGWYAWLQRRAKALAATRETERLRQVRKENMIEEIYVALKPNGGSSIADHMADVRKRTERIDRTVSTSEIGRRTLVAVMEIGEWHSDSDGQCIWINGAACRLCNRPEDDFLGRNWVNVIHPADVPRVIDEWDDAVRERRQFRSRYRWTTSEGESIPITVLANPVLDSGGVLTGWVAIVKASKESE